MKRLLIALGIALVAPAVDAQEGPGSYARNPQEAGAQAAPPRANPYARTDMDIDYRGLRPHPMRERGKDAGDPPVIDHRADTLIVEPTRSSVTLLVPTPP